MSPSTDNGSPLSTSPGQSAGAAFFDGRPDDVFALVAGLTAAVVLAPLVTAVATRALADLALSYVFLLTAGTAFTVVGTLSARRVRGLPERIGQSRWRWALMLAGPVLVAVFGLALAAVGEPLGSDAALGAVGVGGGVLGGWVLGVMAHSRYSKAVVAESAQYGAWRAGWSERRKQPLKALAAAGVVGGSLAVVVALVVQSDLLRLAGQFAIPLGAGVYSVAQPRTYTATATGLEAKLPVVRKFYGWDRFEGYVLADDAIVVHRRAPWRLPVICARDELDDEDAVIEALGRALPRLPDPRA